MDKKLCRKNWWQRGSVITFVLAILSLVFAVFLFFSSHARNFILSHVDLASEICVCLYQLRIDAITSVFAILGLVNFSFPYIVSMRNTKLYGICLSHVMYSRYPWHGFAYIVYTFLVVFGLYCGKMSQLLNAIICFIGVLFSYISTGIVAIIFVFRQQKAVKEIEGFLALPFPAEKAVIRKTLKGKTASREKKERGKKERTERLLQIGDYMHAYFAATHTIPVGVLKGLLNTLGNMPFTIKNLDQTPSFFLYSFSSENKSKDINAGQTIETAIYVRMVCEKFFDGYDSFAQAAFLRKFLFAMVEVLSQSEEEQPRAEKKLSGSEDDILKNFQDRNKDKNGQNPSEKNCRVIESTVIMLCGIAAYFKTKLEKKIETEAWLLSWDRLFDKILSASVYSTADDPTGEKGPCFRRLLRILTLFIEASVLAEAVSIKFPNTKYRKEFMGITIKILERFDIDLNDIINIFPLGQVIVLASENPDYNSESSSLRVYCLLSRLYEFQNKENIEI